MKKIGAAACVPARRWPACGPGARPASCTCPGSRRSDSRHEQPRRAGAGHTDCLLTRPDLRLPADSLLPGQMPTQEARRSALAKTSISAPISTSSNAAPMRSTPGRVCNNASTAADLRARRADGPRNGRRAPPDPRCAASVHRARRWLSVSSPCTASRISARVALRRRLAWRSTSGAAPDEGLDHGPGRLAVKVAHHDTGARPHRSAPCAGGSSAGQLPHQRCRGVRSGAAAQRRRRHERAAQQPGTRQRGQPLRIAHRYRLRVPAHS